MWIDAYICTFNNYTHMKPNELKRKPFNEIFAIILNAEKEESRVAARAVSKKLYNTSMERDDFDEIHLILDNAVTEYAKIEEDWRKENYATAVSVLYYLNNHENDPDFLHAWLLELVEHKNGNIRNAGRRMFELELCMLTLHIRLPDRNISKKKKDTCDKVLLQLFIDMNIMLKNYWLPKYEKYTYIHELPASPYKTAQMILEKMEMLCGKKYFAELTKKCMK